MVVRAASVHRQREEAWPYSLSKAGCCCPSVAPFSHTGREGFDDALGRIDAAAVYSRHRSIMDLTPQEEPWPSGPAQAGCT